MRLFDKLVNFLFEIKSNTEKDVEKGVAKLFKIYSVASSHSPQSCILIIWAHFVLQLGDTYQIPPTTATVSIPFVMQAHSEHDAFFN